MATAQFYDVFEALRTTIRDNFATEKTRMSLTVDTPASSSYTIITPGYNRERHSTYPWVFIVPFPDGGGTPAEYQTTKPRVQYTLPVAIEVVFRGKTGVEIDHIKDILAYAQIIDAALVNNMTLGRSDTLAIEPQDIHPVLYDDSSGALWGVVFRCTLEVQVDYA